MENKKNNKDNDSKSTENKHPFFDILEKSVKRNKK